MAHAFGTKPALCDVNWRVLDQDFAYCSWFQLVVVVVVVDVADASGKAEVKC